MGLEEFNRDFGGKTGGGGVAQFNRDFGGDQPAINPRPEDYGPFQPLGPPSPSPTFGERVGQAYESLAGPVREWFQPAANNLVRAPYEILTGQRPFLTGVTAPAEYQEPPTSRMGQFAAGLANPIPPDLAALGAMLGTLGMSGPAGRIIGATAGAGAGSAAQGDPLSTQAWKGALTGGVTAGLEGLGAGASALWRALPGSKGAINEQATQSYIDNLPDPLKRVVEQEKANVEPSLYKSSIPQAALQETALSEKGRQALGAHLEAGMNEAIRIDNNPAIDGPALREAYSVMPDLAKRMLIGQVDPAGFNLRQVQELIQWVGKDFAEAPLAQGAGSVPQQMLYKGMLDETRAALSPAAAAAYLPARRDYATGTGMMDVVRMPNAFTGERNRIFLNQRQVETALSQRRAELAQELGTEGFKQLVADFIRGGQLGTGSRIVSGSGEALEALRQTYGRGQGGSPQILGSLLRVGLPNVGSEYTGRAPYAVPDLIQMLADLAANRVGTQQQLPTRPMPIGPIPGR